MKKTLVYGAATAAVLASLGAGFGLVACTNESAVETVYGPPLSEAPSSSSEADEPIEDVYGPPVDESDSSASSNSMSEEEEEELINALYGPAPDSEKPDAEN